MTHQGLMQELIDLYTTEHEFGLSDEQKEQYTAMFTRFMEAATRLDNE